MFDSKEAMLVYQTSEEMLAALHKGLVDQAVLAIMPEIEQRVSIIIESFKPALAVYFEQQKQQYTIECVFQRGK